MAPRMQLLEQKLELLKKIAFETERMGNLLQNNDLDALAVCIEKKSGYIEDVDAIDAQMQGDPAPREAVLQAEITAVLETVRRMDRQNMELAKDLRSSLAAQIREANQSRNLRSYGPSQPGIKFVDREG